MSSDNVRYIAPAPKVSPDHIEELMASIEYKFTVIPDTMMTIAAAVLPNGFIVATGESACVCPANFNEALGRQYAMADAEKNARGELWKLEGWRLRCELDGAHRLTNG